MIKQATLTQADLQAMLDAALGSVPAGMTFKGLWNATTNSPNISLTTPVSGDYYIVSNAGNTSLDGENSWQQKDWAIHNGGFWSKLDNSEAVTQVAGKTGNVSLVAGDVGLGSVNNTADMDKPVSTAQALADAAVVSTAAGDATTKANSAQSNAVNTSLQKSANLSDLAVIATARTNLGLAPYVSAAAPTANDDSNDGYYIGKVWIDTSTSPAAVYICTDATPAAAVWWTAPTGGSTMVIGHSWERLDPVTAGAGAEFLDSDTLVRYLSSGQATPGWAVQFGDYLGPDMTGILTTSGGAYQTAINGAGYTLGNITVAILFYLDATITGDKAIGAFGARAAAHGVEILLGMSGGNTLLRSYQNGTFTTMKTFAGALATGWHAVCVSVIAGSKWRFSFDGEAVADVSLGVAYATPTTATLGFGISSSPDVPLSGKVCDMGVWNSQLSDANIVALATLPGTPTYRLPITAAIGLPAIRVEANRYNPEQPLLMNARGLVTPMIVQSGVRKWLP